MNVVTIFCIFDHCHCSKLPDFTQIFYITARKVLVLAKYFLLISQKNYDFFKFLKPGPGGGEKLPPCSPANTAMAVLYYFQKIGNNNFN